jgi:ElaB/YqjD/DUF883 family membrane-anchored ribosome-binding protein
MTNPFRTSTRERISDAAEQAIDATTHAIDTGRQFTTDAASRVGATARELREDAVDLAHSAAASVSDAAAAAQRQLGGYAKAGRRYVENDPWKAVLIAAAVGAAAAALILVLSRRHED